MLIDANKRTITAARRPDPATISRFRSVEVPRA
jgi:hypothetical protein